MLAPILAEEEQMVLNPGQNLRSKADPKELEKHKVGASHESVDLLEKVRESYQNSELPQRIHFSNQDNRNDEGNTLG